MVRGRRRATWLWLCGSGRLYRCFATVGVGPADPHHGSDDECAPCPRGARHGHSARDGNTVADWHPIAIPRRHSVPCRHQHPTTDWSRDAARFAGARRPGRASQVGALADANRGGCAARQSGRSYPDEEPAPGPDGYADQDPSVGGYPHACAEQDADPAPNLHPRANRDANAAAGSYLHANRDANPASESYLHANGDAEPAPVSNLYSDLLARAGR